MRKPAPGTLRSHRALLEEILNELETRFIGFIPSDTQVKALITKIQSELHPPIQAPKPPRPPAKLYRVFARTKRTSAFDTYDKAKQRGKAFKTLAEAEAFGKTLVDKFDDVYISHYPNDPHWLEREWNKIFP